MKYYYSSYWNAWSRILSENNKVFRELNLTPIPGCASSTWKNDVAPIVIRTHGTARRRGDIQTDVLPENVRQQMVLNLGEELVNKLLEGEF
jgi:hypothetical protein